MEHVISGVAKFQKEVFPNKKAAFSLIHYLRGFSHRPKPGYTNRAG